MIGSLYVNGEGDSQLVINRDACTDDEVRLCILNHDEGEAAYIVVNAKELLERVQEIERDGA
jgi:hypothetical protein